MTRKLLFISTLALALSAFTFAQTGVAGTSAASAAAPAAASTTAASVPTGPPPTKVGVIDIQAAIFNTNEGRRDIETLAKKFDPKRAELNSLGEEIDNLKKQLAAQQDKLNEEERASRVRAIEQKQKNYQRLGEDAQADFQNQQNELVNRIGQRMLEVLRKYAETNNLAVVIDASNQSAGVLWAADQVNITPAIVAAYNAQSNVPAQPPSAPAPAGSRPGAKPPAAGTTPKKPASTTTTPPKQ
jgi:Skp family chaperone for outer membrane proteins